MASSGRVRWHSWHLVTLCDTLLFGTLTPAIMPRHPDCAVSRRTYSNDLWEHVVYQRFPLGSKVSKIANSLNMSQRVVERVLKQWKDTGEVAVDPSVRSKKRSRVMDQEEHEVCQIVLILFWLISSIVSSGASQTSPQYLLGRDASPAASAARCHCRHLNNMGGLNRTWPDTKKGTCCTSDCYLTLTRCSCSSQKPLQSAIPIPVPIFSSRSVWNRRTALCSLMRAASTAAQRIGSLDGLTRAVAPGLVLDSFVGLGE